MEANDPAKDQSNPKEPSFAFGISKTATDKQKVKTAEETAEMRKQTFGANIGESSKRSREDYAVKLRKERR